MIIEFLASLFLFPQVFAASQPLEDYNYQLNLYINNYSQWQVLSQDYKENPTLDNQQKAILVAKKVVNARETSRAALFRYLFESISRQSIDQELVSNTLVDVNNMISYHLNQAQAIQSINSPADLDKFNQQSEDKLSQSNKIYMSAQIVNKLSQLIRYQLEGQRIYAIIKPKVNQSIYPVKNGLDQIDYYNSQIDLNVEQIKTNLKKLNLGEKSAQTFYTENGTLLDEIKKLESNLTDVLIDLDTNYATH